MIENARALEPLLGRRDRRSWFNGRWDAGDGDPLELVDAHLRGELLLGPKHGGTEATTVIAWDIDGPKEGRVARANNDAPKATRVLLDVLGLAGIMPPIVATSKSGKG